MPEPDPIAELLAQVAGEHRYRDVLGDYEIAPHYKHFGCSCGWEQDIAGMSGWRSWVAAHQDHLAEAQAAALRAAVVPEIQARALVEAAQKAEWKYRSMTFLRGSGCGSTTRLHPVGDFLRAMAKEIRDA